MNAIDQIGFWEQQNKIAIIGGRQCDRDNVIFYLINRSCNNNAQVYHLSVNFLKDEFLKEFFFETNTKRIAVFDFDSGLISWWTDMSSQNSRVYVKSPNFQGINKSHFHCIICLDQHAIAKTKQLHGKDTPKYLNHIYVRRTNEILMLPKCPSVKDFLQHTKQVLIRHLLNDLVSVVLKFLNS